MRAISFLIGIVFLAGCKATPPNNQDLHFIYSEIKNNHPGYYNKEDPNFRKHLVSSYINANKRISANNQHQIINDFITSFNDNHLNIKWYEDNLIMNEISDIKKFQIKYLNPDIAWITLPTFIISPSQQKDFNLILKTLPNLRTKSLIVFNLRGNQGGNSDHGTQIVYSLFGENYARSQHNIANNNQYVDWRASVDNLSYIQNMYKNSKLDCVKAWLKDIVIGLRQSIDTKKPYYREVSMRKNIGYSEAAINLCNARVIVIIDYNNFSAALDFIDALKIVKANISLIGKTTRADKLYMEVRDVSLPSGNGILYFPIKVYRNRLRGDNEPYKPDFDFDTNDHVGLEEFVKKHSLAEQKKFNRRFGVTS